MEVHFLKPQLMGKTRAAWEKVKGMNEEFVFFRKFGNNGSKKTVLKRNHLK
jgi:hypothetical protein